LRPVQAGNNKNIILKPSAGTAKSIVSGVSGILTPKPSMLFGQKAQESQSAKAMAKTKLAAEAIGISPGPDSAIVLSALMGEGLKLDKELANRVLTAFLAKKKDPLVARLLARAEAAGMESDAAIVKKLLSFVGGIEEKGSPTDSESGASQENRQKNPFRRDTDNNLDGKAEFGKKTDIIKLAKELQFVANTALLDRELLQLNKAAKDGGGWIVIPFDFELDGMKLHGFFRICYYDTYKIKSFIADIRFLDQIRVLELKGLGSSPVIRYGTPIKEEAKKVYSAFSPKIRTEIIPVYSVYCTELEEQKVLHEEA